ncbi:MAG: glycoside hydrolase family 3 C-terminal domain-containing protein [Calditrichae bacterium]|nr:glycoside hydrolase family 3 C-terminal domain-containing protein [Calditrichota bacterium]MCB9058515.1 glycoside hydrolase family 3 C-terminal domain-containing protein [Calditrichia bacterium]
MLFRDSSQPLETRINDLVNQLTIDEKISQLMNNAPAIDRLGIPAYNWWNEALHGVARAGVATVFPQAIGLAATWNPDRIYEMADVISTEARAKYQEAIRNGEHGIYQGLTFWSPNINIFRDPRWGRGQETYGEDPYLTSRIGIAFVKGIQGTDPDYLKAAACAKHFAVHSGPENLRHQFDVKVSDRDLWETYLPAFRALVQEANVEAVMCAYNRYDGEACCGSPFLLNEILRKEWGFNGHIVSDCGAIADIFEYHKIVNSAEEAAAVALNSGTDVNCGNMYSYLKDALQQGLVTEKEIDLAVSRLFRTRFKLGMFDPPQKVKYSEIPYSMNNNADHDRLALEVARESIVLLKNENNFLPLSADLKKIAVIGPNADNLDALLGNYNGTPSAYITPLEGIRRAVSEKTTVSYVKGVSYTKGIIELMAIPQGFFTYEGQDGLLAEYFDNMELKGKPFSSRVDPNLDCNWAQGNPVPGLPTEQISARWTGELTPKISGKYTIGVTSDDGSRFYFDDELVIDAWVNQGATTRIIERELTAGKSYPIKVEYFQNGGDAVVQLGWQEPDQDTRAELLTAVNDADVVVFVGGISPRLEGEEMGSQVNYEGFFRGDRTSINLPDVQTELIKELKGMGKQIVLVIQSGSAVAANWENENLPAIIQAWYPGQNGGQAIADVIFGKYNPSGKLPVTVYKSIDQLPAFENYDMDGRTYRYFKGDPLFPFGYGLSFTNFEYSDLEVGPGADGVDVSVKVKNIGSRDGDEVVQVYVSDLEASVPVAQKSLKAFKKVFIKQGEFREIKFTLSWDDFALYDAKMQRGIEPGDFRIQVGGSSDSGLSGIIELD